VNPDREVAFDVRLSDLIFSVSSAIDLVSPMVAGHHLRVARIARAIAGRLNFPACRKRDLLLAAALHDCGAFSLGERLKIHRSDVEPAGDHAEAGYRLLRASPHFARAAEIVRHHHLPWENRRGEIRRGRQVPLESHLLHLADRVSVLPIDWSRATGWSGAAMAPILAGSGARFVPELVEALRESAAVPDFWRDLGAVGDADLREDRCFGDLTLAEADVRSLARLFWQLVDFRSCFTATHTSGVAAVTGFLAAICGVSAPTGRKLVIAAGLHDLGKIAVSSETLEKERSLTREDWSSLHEHPLRGWRILERIPGLEEINPWASYHHERLDGTGYPFRVPGTLIPRESRIVAVADVFTALTEERPYRRGMSTREAVRILREMADEGGLDRDVVQGMTVHREEAAVIRRLAQEGASGRYFAFREHDADVAAA